MILNLSPYPIYGVSGLFQSEPSLTRTDDAVTMSCSINSSSGSISSDFNDVFPWNEAQIVLDSAGKFLKMPQMYFRVGTDTENRITDIAVSKYPSGGGKWYRVKPFMYSCYGGSVDDNKLLSVSGAAREVGRSISEFRGLCAQNGSAYSQLDLYHRTVMLFLWWIEFATKNSADIMTGAVGGSGTSGSYRVCATGGTDSVLTPSGFEPLRAQMRYHYIEDFVGNLYEYVDGVYSEGMSTPDYVTDKPQNFSESVDGKTPVSVNAPSYGCLAAFLWDSDKPFLCTPCYAVSNEDCDTYFCDRVVHNISEPSVLSVGSVYGMDYASRGITWHNYMAAGSQSTLTGARLIKRLS